MMKMIIIPKFRKKTIKLSDWGPRLIEENAKIFNQSGCFHFKVIKLTIFFPLKLLLLLLLPLNCCREHKYKLLLMYY